MARRKTVLLAILLASVWIGLLIFSSWVLGWEELGHITNASNVAILVSLAISLARIHYYWKGLNYDAPHLPHHLDWPEALNDKIVSIIVPAYNEEAGIEATVRAALSSTSAGPDRLELIVVDDDSKDGTFTAMSRVKDLRFRPISGLPRGIGVDWKGKNWACYQGFKDAKGDILIFMDSDVTLLEGAIESFLHGLVNSGADWVTCNCFSRMSCSWEYAFNIPLQIGMNQAILASKINRGRRIYAYGPLNVFHRKTYESLGGHKAVGHYVAESHHLAMNAKEMGFKMQAYLVFNLAELSWYHNFEECWTGQLKSIVARLAEQRRYRYPFFFLLIALYTGLRLYPWVMFVSCGIETFLELVSMDVVVGLILSATDIGLVYLLRIIGLYYCGYPTKFWFLEPVSAVLLFALVVRGLIRPEAKWGGHSTKNSESAEKPSKVQEKVSYQTQIAIELESPEIQQMTAETVDAFASK